MCWKGIDLGGNSLSMSLFFVVVLLETKGLDVIPEWIIFRVVFSFVVFCSRLFYFWIFLVLFVYSLATGDYSIVVEEKDGL